MENVLPKRRHDLLKVFGLGLLAGVLSFAWTIIWQGGLFSLAGDFNAQQIPFAMAGNDAVRAGNWGWAWFLDLGSSFIGGQSFYTLGNPSFWIAAIFPSSWFMYVVGWLYALKYAVATLTSYMYIRQYVRNFRTASVGAILYAFSGYMATDLLFYHFHDVVALFPLLLLTFDALMVRGRKGPFIFAVLINALVNYFFIIGEIIFLVAYYVICYLVPDFRKNIRKLPQILFEGALGCLLGAALLVPSFLFTVQNPRVEVDYTGSNSGVFTFERYLYILKGLLFPGEVMSHQCAVIRSNFSSCNAYLPMVGMVLVIAFLSLHKKHWVSRMLRFSLVMAIVPFFNASFSLFAGLYCRWYYMPILFMSLASAIMLERWDVERRSADHAAYMEIRHAEALRRKRRAEELANGPATIAEAAALAAAEKISPAGAAAVSAAAEAVTLAASAEAAAREESDRAAELAASSEEYLAASANQQSPAEAFAGPNNTRRKGSGAKEALGRHLPKLRRNSVDAELRMPKAHIPDPEGRPKRKSTESERAITKGFIIWGLITLGFVAFLLFVPWSKNEPSKIFEMWQFAIWASVSAAGTVITWLILTKKKKKRLTTFTFAVMFFAVLTTGGLVLSYQIVHGEKAKSIYDRLMTSAKIEYHTPQYRFQGRDNLETLAHSYPASGNFCSTVSGSIFRFYEGLGLTRDVKSPDAPDGLYALISARYSTSRKPEEGKEPIQTVYGDSHTYYVYEDTSIPPIGFTQDTYMTMSEFRQTNTSTRAIRMLKTLVVNDEDEAKVSGVLRKYDEFLDGTPNMKTIEEDGRAHLAESATNVEQDSWHYAVSITADQDKFAFFSIPNDDGWSCSVNGEKTDILDSNGFMAVPVKAGGNRIVFRYEVPGLRMGILMSLGAAAVTALYLLILAVMGGLRWFVRRRRVGRMPAGPALSEEVLLYEEPEEETGFGNTGAAAAFGEPLPPEAANVNPAAAFGEPLPPETGGIIGADMSEEPLPPETAGITGADMSVEPLPPEASDIAAADRVIDQNIEG